MLDNFYLASHQLFSYHVIMAAEFEKFEISPGRVFPLKFRKSQRI